LTPFVRLFAAVAAVALTVMTPLPAHALPRPRSDEWWFSAWGVQKDVWPITRGAGVTVAVLDTGVNAKLPELSGAVLKGGDTTGAKTDGRRDLDKQGGGHGTGMAALIAGQGGGSTGFTGIAPGAKILPVRVDSKFGDKSSLFEAFAAGIRFAVDHRAKVINLSMAVNSAAMPDRCDSDVQDAIAYAIQHDVVVVAGAGNTGDTDNWPMMPASCPGVLAVGAIDPKLRPWKGSQRQSYVAVAAPGAGSGIVGAKDEYFPQAWGTSIATALTSGVVALIRSHNPRMPARTVVQRLIATTLRTGGGGRNDQTGYGPIQITSAMNPQRYPVAADVPNPVYQAFDRWQATRYGVGSSPPAVKPSAAGEIHKRKGILPFVVGGAAFVIVVGIIVVILARARGKVRG
jgi:membrane-anchored mycosin MYCP